MNKKTIQFFGPFFTNFSYARITRGLAFGINTLESSYQAYFSGDPLTIDYYPTENDLNKNPDIKAIFKPIGFESDIVIYNNFPKTITSLNGFDKLPGKTKILYASWEESIYPKLWVDEINKHLHGVIAISDFVKNVLINSGVKVPIVVALNSVSDAYQKPIHNKYNLKTKKKFKFFHNSTGKKRKGVDVLLKAYFDSFTGNDDVCLVIKTTPTVENQFNELIDKYRNKNNAEVELIVEDLSDEGMVSLLSAIDACVYPSRAEGFGIPALESMFLNKPVIVTNYSGFTDFCNESNAYLIDYKLEYVDASELLNPGAKWAEPDLESLKMQLIDVYKSIQDLNNNIESERAKLLKAKIKFAKEKANSLTWQSAAKTSIEFIEEINELVKYKEQNLGVLSFFNDETGIADYTEDLYKSVECSFKNFYYLSNKDLADRTAKDEDNVIRCWSTGESSFEEMLNFLEKADVDIIHVQYHSGAMFSITALNLLIEKLKNKGIKSYLTFHAVRGPSFDFIKESSNLKLWDAIFIHNKSDFKYAQSLLSNIKLIPLPTVKFKHRGKQNVKKSLGLDKFEFIVAAHGLLNKHKNIPEIIKAVSHLKKDYPNTLFLSLSAVSPNNIYAQGVYDECISLIESEKLEGNVIFINDFLDDSQIEYLMQSVDATIFAYDDVGESSSASIRKSLASGGVTIVSDINMFQEFKDEVLRLPTPSAQEIYNALVLVLKNNSLRERLVASAAKYVKENTYEKRILEMLSMY